MLIGALMFHCPVLASAPADWLVSLVLEPVWSCETEPWASPWSQPHPWLPCASALWSWSTVWSVPLWFVAVAFVSAVFD